jgi:hypothetical protein
MLAFPDWRNLFHALDHISAGGERVSTMRGCGGNYDAGVADVEPPDPMVHADDGRWPGLLHFLLDA